VAAVNWSIVLAMAISRVMLEQDPNLLRVRKETKMADFSAFSGIVVVGNCLDFYRLRHGNGEVNMLTSPSLQDYARVVTSWPSQGDAMPMQSRLWERSTEFRIRSEQVEWLPVEPSGTPNGVFATRKSLFLTSLHGDPAASRQLR
jgi:hypothetical protein